MLGRIQAPTDVFTITRSTEDCRPVPQVELRFEMHLFYFLFYLFYICRIIETENVGACYTTRPCAVLSS